ncbi:hypothetical protein [Oscillatoria sp. HE19RPO]|nr:hypothetical protein [Oscillatoria sp. HE19RPO]
MGSCQGAVRSQLLLFFKGFHPMAKEGILKIKLPPQLIPKQNNTQDLLAE